MRLTFQVSVELDQSWIDRHAARRAVKFDLESDVRLKILIGLTNQIENALGDAVMHKDGIVAGSVTVLRQEN